MKKTDSACMMDEKKGDILNPSLHSSSVAATMVTSTAPPTLRYFNQVHLPSAQNHCAAESSKVDSNHLPSGSSVAASQLASSKQSTDQQQQQQQHDSPYDEWMCFQKDLSYFTGPGSDGNVTSEATNLGIDPPGRRKTTEEEMHEMFNSNDSKSVDKQLEQLFNATADDKQPPPVSRIDSPLTEFFNNHQRTGVTGGGEGVCGGASAKSVETRLDALFGGCESSSSAVERSGAGGINEKSNDMMTSRHWSASVFQSSHDEEESTSDSFLHKATGNSFELLQQQQQHSSSGGTQKRHWTGAVSGGGGVVAGGNGPSSAGLLYASEPSEAETINPNKRQCMSLDRNDSKPLDDGSANVVKGDDDHRWLLDCAGNDEPAGAANNNSQVQPLGTVSSNGSVAKPAPGLDTSVHHHHPHQHQHGVDESGRAPVINSVHSHHQHNPGSVMNGPGTMVGKEEAALHLPTGMIGGGGGGGDGESSFHDQQQQQQQQQQLNHHHHHQHHHHHHQQTIHDLHQFNHISFDTMGVPNFEEDISRQVQNAIDSILNLQSNETDGSLHYSLDHSFLPDSPLSSGLVNSVTPSPLGGGGAVHHPEAPISNHQHHQHHHPAPHLQQSAHAAPHQQQQQQSIRQPHVGMKRKYPTDCPSPMVGVSPDDGSPMGPGSSGSSNSNNSTISNLSSNTAGSGTLSSTVSSASGNSSSSSMLGVTNHHFGVNASDGDPLKTIIKS